LSTIVSAFFWWHVAQVSLPTYPGAGVAAAAVVVCFKVWVCVCAAAMPAPQAVSIPTTATRRKYFVILRGKCPIPLHLYWRVSLLFYLLIEVGHTINIATIVLP
jgi:hypothetical protein